MASRQERQRLAASAWPRWELGIYNREPKALDALDRLLRDMGRIHERTEPTARELEILAELSQGLTLAEAGQRVYLGKETIKSHLRNVRPILGAKNTTHAVAIALRKGLIE